MGRVAELKDAMGADMVIRDRLRVARNACRFESCPASSNNEPGDPERLSCVPPC